MHRPSARRVCSRTPHAHIVGLCSFAGTGYDGCVDVDECAMGIANCGLYAGCRNTAGSYRCGSCPPGFTMSSNGGACSTPVTPLVAKTEFALVLNMDYSTFVSDTARLQSLRAALAKAIGVTDDRLSLQAVR